MAASRSDISGWYDQAVAEEATHMIVVTDTYDYDDYPIFVPSGENVRAKVDHYNSQPMQSVIEVYDLSLPKDEQMAEDRAMHIPPPGEDDPIPFTEETVEEYLDHAIRTWRNTRDSAIAAEDPIEERMAIHYIDAFQSVRKSVLGSVLEPDV